MAGNDGSSTRLGVQAEPPAADDQVMAQLFFSFFRRRQRQRIAVLHGPRHA